MQSSARSGLMKQALLHLHFNFVKPNSFISTELFVLAHTYSQYVPLLQTMFANLALTNQDHYIPRPFWNAFKDYDGQRLNLREHQDAYEFFTRLQV